MTQHIELYKKYRPRSWAGLIGQNKVAASLRNAVITEKLPTAYLFSGARGTGKTSAAWLLAKSINCEDLQQNGNPCNKCEVCINIDKNTQLGVNYISMANKGSVDDIRTIVQNARLNQPIKRQVWILDEVHNLHKAAFDALLIPLEDKTMPSLFIFCTTEIEKVPQTVLSRVQQRRFTLVEGDTMLSFLKKIGAKEELEISDEDYESSIRQGRGSVRDTLSALEAIIETGESTPTFSGQLLTAITSRDLTSTYKVLAEANVSSVNFRELAEQLFEDLRDLMLHSAGASSDLIGIIPIKDPDTAIKNVGGHRGLVLLMNEVGDGITQMSLGADSRIILEVSLLKAYLQVNKLLKMASK